MSDGTKSRKLSWALKAGALPKIYWNGMMKSCELLARPHVKQAA